jgi:hypothetical protein
MDMLQYKIQIQMQQGTFTEQNTIHRVLHSNKIEYKCCNNS